MPIFAQAWIVGDSTEEKRRSSLGGGAHGDGVLREFGAFDQEGSFEFRTIFRMKKQRRFRVRLLPPGTPCVSGRLKAGDSVLTLGAEASRSSHCSSRRFSEHA
jgi:hypothetical protein